MEKRVREIGEKCEWWQKNMQECLLAAYGAASKERYDLCRKAAQFGFDQVEIYREWLEAHI